MAKFNNAKANKDQAKNKSLIEKDYDPKAIDSSLKVEKTIKDLPAVSKGMLPTNDLLPTAVIPQNPETKEEMSISKNELLRDKINRGEQVLPKDVNQVKTVTTFDEEGNAIDRSDDKTKIKVFDQETKRSMSEEILILNSLSLRLLNSFKISSVQKE